MSFKVLERRTSKMRVKRIQMWLLCQPWSIYLQKRKKRRHVRRLLKSQCTLLTPRVKTRDLTGRRYSLKMSKLILELLLIVLMLMPNLNLGLNSRATKVKEYRVAMKNQRVVLVVTVIVGRMISMSKEKP